MARSVRVLLFVLMLLSVSSPYSSAQVQTGTPQFGSYAGGPDAVNLANLNVEFTVPVINKPGRASNFSYNLVYDSSVWQRAISNGTLSWVSTAGQWGWQGLQPAGVAYVTYALSYSTGACGQNLFYQMWSYSNFQFFDSFGVIHTFPAISGSYMSTPGVGSCPPSGPTPATQPVTQTDETGYTMYASMQANSPSVYMIDKNGKVQYVAAWTTPPTSGPTSITDRNGNMVSQTNGVITDTLNQTALSVIGSAPSNTNLTYAAPSGANVSYVVTYHGYIVRTAFGCSGIAEYNSGSTQIYLLDKITLPDTSFYQFSYEQTPGFSSDVTGRIASVTLPTGGQLTYTYTGGSSGHITCADGSASGLTRQTPDGTWTYTRTPETGAAYVTKVTDPQNNNTLIQLQGIYETQRDIYQGAAPSFSTFPIPESTLQTSSLLGEIQSCYNASTTACTNTAIALPITQRTITTQLSGAASWANAQTSRCIYKYSSTGSLTEQDDYDYGVGTVGALVKKTAITYASLTNITDFPQQITVTNGSGTVVSQTKYNYGDAVTGTSGTPQHTTPPGSRGNVLSVNLYTQGTTYLTQSTTYFDTGNAQTVTDVNGAQTTYTYGACGNSFPTNVAEPLSLSKSMTWNCTGGVQLTAKDENLQTTTTTYNDQYFWRPASVTDPLTNATLFAYSASNPAWVVQSLTFNGNQSNAYTGTGFDGLSRVVLQSRQQSPSGTAWDQVTQSYDSNGRPWKTSVPCTNTGAWTCPNTATTTTYDALNRPLLITDGRGGTITYSYSQNDVLVAVGPPPTGENAKRRQLEYDGLGRLTSVCEVTSATGSGACGQHNTQTGFWTKYTYDALGNLTGVSQNAQGTAQTRSYAYDLLSRLTSETNPESGTTTYAFDSASGTGCAPNSPGDLIKRVDASGAWTCFNYDALHRLFDVGNSNQSASNPCKRFRYDNSSGYPGSTKPAGLTNTLGRLIEAATDACSTSDPIVADEWFSYTARGEVSDLYESTPHSGGYYHTAATYWANGAVNLLTGAGGYSAAYNLDGEGRVYSTAPSVGALNSTLYNAASQPTQITYASSDSDTFTYDTYTNRMTQYKFTVNGQSVIGNLTWNPVGTLASLAITDPFNSANAQTCNYSHDDLTRIASANCGSAANQTFSYDAFGNINKLGSPYSFQPTYNSSTNRMASISGSTPTYDANGDVLSDFLHSYTWDVYGRPVTIDGVSVTYDALGRMVEQNRSGVYSEIVYAPTGTKIEIMNGQSYTTAFVPLPGGAVAVYKWTVGYYRHPDHLGSSRFASTTSRTMYYDGAYAPFGEPYAQTGSTDLSFTGQNQDTVSNLYDFPAREYGIQGRWPSPDPAGLAVANLTDPQSWNRFSYVHNSPMNLIDPFGLTTCDANGNNCFDSVTVTASGGDFFGGAFFLMGGLIHALILDTPEPPNVGEGCRNGVGSGGVGLGAGYNADLGAGLAGTSSTGGVAGGLFHNKAGGALSGWSAGGTASGGATAYAGNHIAGVPTQSSSTTFVLGAYAGAGANINFTNAASAQQLSGPFTTISGNVGLGVANLGIQISFGGGIWQVSITPPLASVGIGAAGSIITTNTAATRTGCR